ncbi:MAG TPA: adenylosuccinate synthase [Candidatus Thermoplasmatota archaeon]|nr:adenylosuccinate synthase [Candidatus Thermoplasmatota archaeon]
MTVTVVLGAQWGDEGKGKVTDFYADRVGVVARYQGGNNAGHTVVAEGRTFKFHLLPSGVVRPKTKNVLGNGLVVDPAVLLDEMKSLEDAGLGARHVFVSDRAHVILPWHRDLDGARETRAAGSAAAIGTTRKGIGPAYADKAARVGVRIMDLLDAKRLRARVLEALPEKQALLAHHGRDAAIDVDALVETYAAYGKRLAPHVVDSEEVLHDALAAGQDILLEGAQGTFLDIDHGTYPYVTSSSTTAGGATIGTGLPPTAIDEVVGIAKAYVTRVGAGPFPTELPYETTREGKHLTDVGREVGTTTGRRRRTGWLDLPMLRTAIRVNGLTKIALMKLDVLGGVGDIRVAEAYDLDGRVVERFPRDLEALARAKPRYRTFPGFPPLTKQENARAAAEGVDALPGRAREYVGEVERALGVPILLVSLGPEREATAIA